MAPGANYTAFLGKWSGSGNRVALAHNGHGRRATFVYRQPA